MATTVEITSPTSSATYSYTLAWTVSGVVAPLNELGYRINGNAEVTLTPVIGDGTADITLRFGRNTVAVRALKGADEATDAIPVDVSRAFRGLLTDDDVLATVPRSIRENG